MENQKQQLTDAAKIAQFRLSVIAPVIHGLYPDVSRNAYYRRVTEKPLTLPDGSTFQYNPKTISKWVSLYQTGGIDALMPKERSRSFRKSAAIKASSTETLVSLPSLSILVIIRGASTR